MPCSLTPPNSTLKSKLISHVIKRNTNKNVKIY